MSDADEVALTGSDEEGSQGWWIEELDVDDVVGSREFCELAPHSAMIAGAGRLDSPSPQDIRLLHDLVEDLTKEHEDGSRPRAEQVRFVTEDISPNTELTVISVLLLNLVLNHFRLLLLFY